MAGCRQQAQPVQEKPVSQQSAQEVPATQQPAQAKTTEHQAGSLPSWKPVGRTPWSQVAGTWDTDVNCFAVVNGTLYASTDGGVWSWDGSSWSQVGGSNALGGVGVLAVSNGTLYAQTGSTGIWSWNGSDWFQLVGSNILPDENLGFSSMAVVDGTVYAVTHLGIWSRNGSSWTPLPVFPWSTDIAGGSEMGPGLVALDGKLYAGTAGHGVWSWNGSSWTNLVGSKGLGAGPVFVGDLVMSNGALYASSWEGLWSWNGSSWTKVCGSTNPINGADTCLYSFNSKLYAGTTKGVWSWDGSSWSQVPSTGNPQVPTGNPPDGMTAIRCLIEFNGALYAGTDYGVFSTPLSETLPMHN
jgi:hypothetical protein